MSASNKLGHGIGEERMKLILDKYPDILNDYKKWSKEEFINNLKELNGFEEKISSLIVNNFNEFIKFYNSIKTLITIEKVIEKKIIKSKYTDLTIVISGFRDSELESKLEIKSNSAYFLFTNSSLHILSLFNHSLLGAKSKSSIKRYESSDVTIHVSSESVSNEYENSP